MGEGVTLVLVDHESMHASPRTIEADLNDDGMIAIYAHEEFGGSVYLTVPARKAEAWAAALSTMAERVARSEARCRSSHTGPDSRDE